MRLAAGVVTFVGLTWAITPVASAALPEPAKGDAMIPWQIPWGSDLGVMSATDLLEKPAGKAGVIGVRGEHFVTADGKRIRFWGVNTAFSANFPTHQQADVLAPRLAALGVNCVRFHHMDMQAWPAGLFTDNKLESLHPEALDRLDYFIAALKKQGIYANINLHVSRSWSRAHKMPNADKLDMDKIADIFYPELIDAQKKYARDLLGRVNKYTGVKYADEPAIAMVEINNENTMFLWGGDKRIAELPEPYGPYLTELWNRWLVKKYETREKLKEAWSKGEERLGANLLKPMQDPKSVLPKPTWNLEAHEGAAAKLELIPESSSRSDPSPILEVSVSKRTDTAWHVQLSQGGLKLRKGQSYTVSFDIRQRSTEKGRIDENTVGVAVTQAHSPWNNLGHQQTVKPGAGQQRVVATFMANADEDNARLCFMLGRSAGVAYSLSNISVAPGGVEGLRDGEEFGKSVDRRRPEKLVTRQRSDDWFDFLQGLDESYFVSMREFLKKDVGVKQPITGTIGLGALGTMSQAKMDFVDGHSYWDHPRFPGKGWDSKNWTMHNRSMSDDPAGATFWSLAATRVAGKPFTVTEYNHAAPNEWQAEGVPMIAAFAAAQDWDGVFLFAYSHNDKYETRSMDGFFDLEGNGGKLAQMPLAARMFLGGMGGRDEAMPLAPLAGRRVIRIGREDALQSASRYYFHLWGWIRDTMGTAPEAAAGTDAEAVAANAPWRRIFPARLAVSFDDAGRAEPVSALPGTTALAWESKGVGTGRFVCTGRGAAVFTGFVPAGGVEVGAMRIERAATPFLTVMAVSSEATKEVFAGPTLLCLVGRTSNTGMTWNAARTSVSTQWGKGPALVEKSGVTVSIKREKRPRIVPIGADGKALAPISAEAKGGRWEATLPGETVWYQLGDE